MSARSPKLFAITFIALAVVFLYFQSIFISEGEPSKQADSASEEPAAFFIPTAEVMDKKDMANTGPGVAGAMVEPSTESFFYQPSPTPRSMAYSPEFLRFIDKVANGEKGFVKGVFVPGVLALPVIQQPEGKWSFVSEELGLITEFQSAARHGVVGLLAHNYLSGELFFELEIGKEVWIVYGDKAVDRYRIEGIYNYQKLTPSNSQSDLIDLLSGEKVTTEQVFNRFYRGQHHVTFQTCLEAHGLSNWGLTFTVAVPVDEYAQ